MMNEYFGFPEIVSYACFISFFYLNAYYLLPKLYFKKKIILYIICVVAIIVAIGVTNAYLTQIYSPQVPPRPFIRLLFSRMWTSIANLAISTSYRMIIGNFKRERLLKEKEKENLVAELSFLRSQISPHFVFNVLNSAVSLVRKKSDQVEPVLMELSNLMRYMLYDSDSDKVSVKTVEQYVTSYINLQKLRFGDDVRIDFVVEDNSTTENFIEPMLLIPLIENAFKHGIAMIENPEIKVSLIINQDNIKLFVCNKYNNNHKIGMDAKSGIGLKNLKRRLNLLYPEKHVITDYIKENKFVAKLKIQLK